MLVYPWNYIELLIISIEYVLEVLFLILGMVSATLVQFMKDMHFPMLSLGWILLDVIWQML